MATHKVETAIQEVALAAFYGNAHRAAQQLKAIPASYGTELMEGALRQWAMVVPFVQPAEVEEILAKYSLGIVLTETVIDAPVEVTVASQWESEPQNVATEEINNQQQSA